jgi:predicted dehydrogenase
MIRRPTVSVSGQPTRRDFLRGLALGAGSLAIAPTLLSLTGCASVTARARPATERLNIGFVGAGGKGRANLDGVLGTGENVTALCDVDDLQMEKSFAKSADKHPNARKYRDWRELLDQGADLDAVVISTPDHMHAPVAMAAMAKGLHIYCEKPLTRTIWEARKLAALATTPGLATQMGNQGSANPGLRRGLELINAGIIGTVKEIHAWSNRPVWPQGLARPDGADAIPAHLWWDGFIGVAPMRPFKDGVYHTFKWRGWHDFGSGAFGDMGCHTLNLPFRAFDLADPMEIEGVATSDHLAETFPKASTVRFKFAAKGKLPERTMWWYDGGTKPPADRVPAPLAARGLKGSGLLLVGDAGFIYSEDDYNGKLFLALKGESELQEIEHHPAAKGPAIVLPRAEKGHYQEWIDAIRGKAPTFSSFAIASKLAETCILGSIAQRCPGKAMTWDAAAMQFTNAPDADALVTPTYRAGWA